MSSPTPPQSPKPAPSRLLPANNEAWLDQLASNLTIALLEVPARAAADNAPPQVYLHGMTVSAQMVCGPGVYIQLVPRVISKLGAHTDPRSWLLWTQLLADCYLSNGNISLMSLVCVAYARRRGKKAAGQAAEFVAAEELRRVLCRQSGLPDPGVGPALMSVKDIEAQPWLPNDELVEEMAGLGWAGLIGDGKQVMAELTKIAKDEYLEIQYDGLRVRAVELRPEYHVVDDSTPPDDDGAAEGEAPQS